MDYYNSLQTGLPDYSLASFQSILHTATWVIF